MNRDRVSLRTGCRLHFGLLAFGQPTGRQFGGIGMMLDQPAIELVWEPADEWQVIATHDVTQAPFQPSPSELTARVESFVERWCQAEGRNAWPSGRLIVRAVYAEHVGLGLGTQLGLAVGMLLDHVAGRVPQASPNPSAACGARGSDAPNRESALETQAPLSGTMAADLPTRMGRGGRSSVGTYGFQQGGLIVDPGKLPGESLAPSAIRVELPSAWRVVLVRATDHVGLSGGDERRAFAQLPPIPLATTQQLTTLLEDQILPAARAGDLERLGEGVYAYGLLAGGCFASQQGGPFANAQVAAWVERLRNWGVRGVGQSSWGPTVFGIVPDSAAAAEVVDRCRAMTKPAARAELLIATPARCGFRLVTDD